LGTRLRFFAAAACFYYWEDHKNEINANVMRDQLLHLREDNETLKSQKEHLQASSTEAVNQLKTREDLVQEKEAQLAAEESRLDALGQQSQSQSQQNQSQVAIVKRFNDIIRKLGKDAPADVVERGGRPVLRLPNAQLFAPGDATLTADGKALLVQMAQALNGQFDGFELRVVSYTDSEAEASSAPAQKKDSTDKTASPADTAAAAHYSNSWDLTAARASALARFFRDQTALPFLNVLVLGRGDSEPIASNTGENHARNRRVEITVTPLPIPFRAADSNHDKTNAASGTSSKPPADGATSSEKEKPKKATEKTSAR
jgi:flagellar motor protein MotB